MILPPGSLLTFSGTGLGEPVSLAVSSIKYRSTREAFKRLEFSHRRQREAPNPDGSLPMISQLIGNRPVLYFTGCNDANEKTRDLTPDDSDYDNIYKRFDIRRYEIIGATSLSTQIDALFAIATNHSVRISIFNAFLTSANADVSIDFLTDMQAEDLAYLTTTGITMKGSAVQGALNDMLITEFIPDIAYEIPGTDLDSLDEQIDFSTVLKTWSMVIESRLLVPDRQITY